MSRYTKQDIFNMVEAEDGSKTYQVVLTDKEGTESTVFFNEKGEILK